jgi:hypothetical protein
MSAAKYIFRRSQYLSGNKNQYKIVQPRRQKGDERWAGIAEK